jgi:predicted RNase H-like HicB family nuclease
MKLTLVIRQGSTQLIGQIKEIPGVLTQGRTIEEVKENIVDALELYLEDVREDNSDDKSGIISQEEFEFA